MAAPATALRRPQDPNPKLLPASHKPTSLCGRIVTVQSAKSVLSGITIAAVAKLAIDQMINLSRHAGSMSLMIPEKILQIPVSVIAGHSLSERSTLFLDAWRVHLLAILRVGVCVSGALSLIALLRTRDSMNPLFFSMGVLFYGSVSVDYAFRSYDTLQDVYKLHGGKYEAADSVRSFLTENLGVSTKEHGAVELAKMLNGAEDFASDYSVVKRTFYRHIAPKLIVAISHTFSKEAKQLFLSHLSIPLYTIAASQGEKYWDLVENPIHNESILLPDAVSSLKSKAAGFRADSVNAVETFNEIRSEIRHHLTGNAEKLGSEGKEGYFTSRTNFYKLYSAYRGAVDLSDQLLRVDPAVINAAFTRFNGLTEDEMIELDRRSNAYLQTSPEEMKDTLTAALKTLERRAPEDLRAAKETPAYQDFLKLSGENASLRERLRKTAYRDLLTEKFKSDKRYNLGIQNANELAPLLFTGLRDGDLNLDNTSDQKRYLERAKAYLNEVFYRHNINSIRALENYSAIELPRNLILNAVVSPLLPKGETFQSYFVNKHGLNQAAIINAFFSNYDVESYLKIQEGEMNLTTLNQELVTTGASFVKSHRVTMHTDLLEMFSRDEARFKVEAAYSDVPYQRGAVAIKLDQAWRYVKRRTVVILNTSKSILLPAMEAIGVLAAAFDPRRFAIRLLFAIGFRMGLQGAGRDWRQGFFSFTDVARLQQADALDVRAMAEGCWGFTQSMLRPTVWNMPYGVTPSALLLGAEIGGHLTRFLRAQ